MCLKSTKDGFALEYDSNVKDFVGYGYKILEEVVYNKYKRWKEAKGNKFDENLYALKAEVNTSDNKSVYYPGFHIFINKEDARNYRHAEYGSKVVKVKYRGVVAFGTNEVDFINKNIYGNKTYGPCVIARYMKLVEVLK